MGWFKKHKRAAAVIVVFLLLCLVTIFSYSTAGSSTLVGRGVQKVTSVIAKPITQTATGISNFFTGVFSYDELQKENEELRARVDELEAENLDLQLTPQEMEEPQGLYQAFSFEPYRAGANAVVGRVIELDLSKPYVVFTIDAGTEAGVHKDCVVVDGNGLIGKVTETGDGWSKVVSVLSDGNNISFRVLRDQTITGVVSGDGETHLDGYVIEEKMRIIKGDQLVTTGVGLYPAGILIGTVDTVEYDDDRQMKVITVSPTANFEGLQKVAVFL
jgi:rod shape-determining protein MreC